MLPLPALWLVALTLFTPALAQPTALILPSTCLGCVDAGHGWQIGQCQPIISDLKCPVMDAPCYSDQAGCSVYVDDQAADIDCATDGAQISCAACLGTNSRCTWMLGSQRTPIPQCFSGVGYWGEPDVVASSAEQCANLSVDSNDQELLRAVSSGMSQLNAQYESPDNLQQLVRVLSASRSEGGLPFAYTVQIEMGSTDCPKNAQDISLDACPVSGSTEVHQLVLVPSFAFVIPVQYVLESHVTVQVEMPAPILVGAPLDVDVDDAAMISALEGGMVLFNGDSDSQFLQQAVSIVSATRQVVTGFKYTIQLQIGVSTCLKTDVGTASAISLCPAAANQGEYYELVILDQDWIDPRFSLLSQARYISDDDMFIPDDEMVGGITPVDADSTEVLAAADAAMFLLNSERANLTSPASPLMAKLVILLNVVQATQQVVAGIQYTLQIEIGSTDCDAAAAIALYNAIANDKATLNDLPLCIVQGQGEVVEVVILDQPWQSTRYQLLSHTAVAGSTADPTSATPSHRQLEVTNVEMLSALQAGMLLLNKESAQKFSYQAVRVVEAEQDNSGDGLLYTMLVELGLSDCAKSDSGPEMDGCSIVGSTQFLQMKVWSKPWESSAARYSLGNHPLAIEESDEDQVEESEDEAKESDLTAVIVWAIVAGMAVAGSILGVVYRIYMRRQTTVKGRSQEVIVMGQAVPAVTGSAMPLEEQYAALSQV